MATDPLNTLGYVQTVLTYPFVHKVNFSIGGMTVTGARYAELAQAIGAGLIGVRTVGEIKQKYKGELAPDLTIEAKYEPEKNALIFTRNDYGRYEGEQRKIFHEATHAIFDLWAESRYDKRLGVVDETVAVLAEAYFVGLADSNVDKGNFGVDVDGRGKRAMELFHKLETRTGEFKRDMTIQFITLEEATPLMQAVAADWGFNKHLDKDGIPTDGTKIVHVYDGVKAGRIAGNEIPRVGVPSWYRGDFDDI